MSLATFKKKTINSKSTATKISAKPPGGFWLPQGPFGTPGSLSSVMLAQSLVKIGLLGFSLNGNHRSISVGRDMKMSKSGTPFRGVHAMGWGGHQGRYAKSEPLYNAGPGIIEVKGSQWEYVKPSVLSTKGMLEKKYRWAYNGQYPNYWVQPIYTGNQTDTASQWLYVQNKSAIHDCWYDVNNAEKYVDYYKQCGSTGCRTTPARGYKMVVQQGIAPYTKNLHQPKDSSAHTLRIQRRCQRPTGPAKPFPYAVQTGTGVLRGGISVNNVASSCFTSDTRLSPPAWYTKIPPAELARQLDFAKYGQLVRNNLLPITDMASQKSFIQIVLDGNTGGMS